MFLVIEGVNGVGKTSVINELKKYYAQNNVNNILYTREPYRKGLSYSIITDHVNKTTLDESVFFWAANRSRHIEEIYDYVHSPDRLVVSSRYTMSSMVYQCAARYSMKEIYRVNSLFPKPDLVLYLEASDGICVKRVIDREGEAVVLKELLNKQITCLKRDYEKAISILKLDGWKVSRVDAERPLREVRDSIVESIQGMGFVCH